MSEGHSHKVCVSAGPSLITAHKHIFIQWLGWKWIIFSGKKYFLMFPFLSSAWTLLWCLEFPDSTDGFTCCRSNFTWCLRVHSRTKTGPSLQDKPTTNSLRTGTQQSDVKNYTIMLRSPLYCLTSRTPGQNICTGTYCKDVGRLVHTYCACMGVYMSISKDNQKTCGDKKLFVYHFYINMSSAHTSSVHFLHCRNRYG